MGVGATTQGWGRRFLASALALLLLFAAGLVLSEVLLRVLWPAGDHYYIWPPGLSVTFRPNPAIVPGVAPEAHFHVNSRGALGEELSAQKTNEYRVLTIGGSTTQCIMLDQSKMWPALLERALARTAVGRRVRIDNLGRAGFNSRDHLGAMRLVVGQYDADAVVMLLGANDW